MKKIKFKKGTLVQPIVAVQSSYSGYGGRPEMYFMPNMLGVVREDDADMGVQIEYIDPASGCMECARVSAHNLDIIAWPSNCVDLTTVVPVNVSDTSDYWFCGSITYLGVVQYIKAIASLSYDYLESIGISTIRVPGVHSSRLRSVEPVPEVFMPERKQVIDTDRKSVV